MAVLRRPSRKWAFRTISHWWFRNEGRLVQIIDVDGVIDREDHQGAVGIERVGGEHRRGGVGEPALLAEAIGDPGRQRAAAQDEVAGQECGVIGIARP